MLFPLLQLVDEVEEEDHHLYALINQASAAFLLHFPLIKCLYFSTEIININPQKLLFAPSASNSFSARIAASFYYLAFSINPTVKKPIKMTRNTAERI